MTRTTGSVILGINGLLLAGLAAFNLVVVPPSAPRASGPSARLTSVVGQVEVRRGEEQRWEPAKSGDELKETDEVRTGLFSEATVQLRGASSVVVAADSNFVVGREVVERSSFELGTGQITAAITQGAKREFEFRSRGSDAVASSQHGEFSMSNDGKGTVVVDDHEGEVKVQAAGKEVMVDKGKRSVVGPNQAAPRVLPIPTSVALQVKWPPTKTDRTVATVTGKTTVGAVLLVNGIVVRADTEGNFSVDVALKEGGNRLVVNATDASGSTATSESPEIQVDTKPPGLKVDAEGLWK